ncbi:hypothetical protein Tcan_17134 [Toxocara canis]|uniref:Uncharacterized protein n=1 Tax=Toxocara canis TaxID=6265 RepID=A0A0B2W063_TOXCA|nr:hypothetical protein Tcan_17134 [Toxocara canis]
MSISCSLEHYNVSEGHVKCNNVTRLRREGNEASDTPIGLVFIVDHSLPKQRLEVVRRLYHSLACLMPDDVTFTHVMVLHITDIPTLLHMNPHDMGTIHQLIDSNEELQKAMQSKPKRKSFCAMILLAIQMVSKWRSDAFIEEKLVKHIVSVYETDSFCKITNISYRWYYDTITIGQMNSTHLHKSYARFDPTSQKRILNRGVQLELPAWHQLTQEWIDEQTSLMSEFLHSIIIHSVTVDAVANTANHSSHSSKWLRFGEKEFRRSDDTLNLLKKWGAILSGARMTFVVLGGIALFLLICTMCACTCLLSADIEDEYVDRRQRRQRIADLQAAEDEILLRQRELANRVAEGNEQNVQNAVNRFQESPLRLENIDGTVTARSGELPSVLSATQLSSCSEVQIDETVDTAISIESERSASNELVTAFNADGDLRVIYKVNK